MLYGQRTGAETHSHPQKPGPRDIRVGPSGHQKVLREGGALTDHVNPWFNSANAGPQRGTGLAHDSGAMSPSRPCPLSSSPFQALVYHRLA